MNGLETVAIQVTTPNYEPELPRLYSLEEVAQMTGIALRTLQRDCRANRVTHFHKGRTRAMTAAHINELIEKHSMDGIAPEPSKDQQSTTRARVDRLQARRARAASGS